MPLGLLHDVESQGPPDNPAGTLPDAVAPRIEQPAYLARIATLPDSLPEAVEGFPGHEMAAQTRRPDSARLDQIEHALTILASVVARLAKETQLSRLQLRATGNDPGGQEERRAQRELVRSMQARLAHLEERIERQNTERISAPAVALPHPEVAEQLTASLTAIRDTLAAIAKRRPKVVSGVNHE